MLKSDIVSSHSPESKIFKTSESGKGDRTKQKCIEAAVAILAESGMDLCTYEEVAKRVGLSRQLVKKYFPEKAALVQEAAHFVRVRFQDFVVREMRKAKGYEAMLLAYVRASLLWPLRFGKEARFWMCYYHFAAAYRSIRKANSDFVELGFERLVSLLSAIQEESGKPKSDLKVKAKLIQTLITGAIVSLVTERVPFEKSAYIDFVAQMCETIAFNDFY